MFVVTMCVCFYSTEYLSAVRAKVGQVVVSFAQKLKERERGTGTEEGGRKRERERESINSITQTLCTFP